LTMKKLLSGWIATTLAAAFAIGSALPLNAAPIYVPNSEQMRVGAPEPVKYGGDWRRGNYRHWRAQRGWERRHAWRSYRPGYYYRRHYNDYGPYYGFNRPYYPRYYPGYYRPYYPRYYPGYYPNYYRPNSGVSLYFSF
jgi:hypothetical protein